MAWGLKDHRPLFSSDWPRYAIASHVVFWLTSAVFLLTCVGAIAGLMRAERAFFMLAIWLVSGVLVGASALFSGRLYIGNQVFSREPTTGWSAKVFGALILLSAGALFLFGYGLSTVRH